MPLNLHVGPSASGKTHALLAIAAHAASPLHGVWWIGLPHQRERTQHRIARALARDQQTRAIPRFEYLTLQQLLYRLIETHHHVPPPLAGPGLQLAHTAIAAQRALGRPPSPGEAHLYLHAIRDAKRADLNPEQLPNTPTATQLQHVYREYEAVRAQRWADYEDYRRHAHTLLQQPQRARLPSLIIDGFLEHPPADLRLIHALAQHTNVHLALEHQPPGLPHDTLTSYPQHPQRTRHTYQHPNPIEETRWVLRALKRDLHQHVPPHELAIIAPPNAHHAFTALAPSYGVPLRSSRPPSLADSRAGRLLQRLLALTHDLGPDALRAIPNLAPLARALAERGLHGNDAAERIAEQTGLRDELQRWRAHLALPNQQRHASSWITRVLDTLETLDPELPRHPNWGEQREQLRLRGSEASQIDLTRLATWWPLLLAQYNDPSERPEGIALLEPDAATGAQYQRAYLTRASVGQYEHAASEDHFLSEDERAPRNVREHGLPQRVSNRSDQLAQHLLQRAQTLIISYPSADQDVPLESDPRLINHHELRDAPQLPAGNASETRTNTTPHTTTTRLQPDPNSSVRLRTLQRYHESGCGFRAHFENLLRPSAPSWLQLIGALTRPNRLTPERLERLKHEHPNHATWLTQHAPHLTRLALGARVTHPAGAHALVHGLQRHPGTLELITFAPNDSDPDPNAQHKRLNTSWEHRHAHATLSHAFALPTRAVIWPIGRDPITLDPPNTTREREPRALNDTLTRYRQGDATPNPGFHCRTCPLAPSCPSH